MRIIIVGAGPGGLILGHMLQKAGLYDYVILERREQIVELTGAGLGLWPHSFRILDQLGLLEAAEKLAPQLTRSTHLGPKGEVLWNGNLYEIIREK
jgi:2-polyprenyl-6-methoxyphenol hydroxylase-like FAD-dependent oxidoreductase